LTSLALLVNGASGSVGSAAVQQTVVRGARVIGTASRQTTTAFARWGPSPSPTGRAWPGEFARSRPAASAPRSMSPGAGSGRFWLPLAQTLPLAEVAQAHRVSEQGHVRGKLVLLVG